MTFSARLCCTTALALVLIPRFGMAEVTVDDVWRNHKDYLAAIGGDFVASVKRVGDTLTVSESSLGYKMPFDLGGVKFTFPTFDLVDNGDGTVAVINPQPITYGIGVDITGKGSFSVDLNFELEGYETVASGEPNDVIYTWSVDRMDMSIGSFAFDFQDEADQKIKEPKLSGSGSLYDMAGVMRVRVGSKVEIDYGYSSGRQEMRFNGELADKRFNHISGAQNTAFESSLTLPRNGMDILNLAAAVREGLALRAAMTAKGTHTSEVREQDGVTVSEQSSRIGEQSLGYEFGQAGLRIGATAVDAELDVKPGKEVPFALKLRVEKAGITIALPLAASSELQDFTYAFSLIGLEMADDLWALFDPQEKLPRQSANVTTDFSGKVLNKVNWLDFLAVKAILDKGEVPVEIHQVTMDELLIEMAGAKLSGTGSASFDNSDLESRGGMPKPSGVVDLVLSGGNGLLDNLVAMGLLTDQDATGARMAVAVFTSPDPEAGEDVLKSRLEMTDEGHILANGQRIQ